MLTMDWETLERNRVQRAWLLGAAAIALLFSFLPLGVLSDLARLYPGPRLQTDGPWLTLLVGLPLFTLGVHGLLILPFLNGGFLKAQEAPARLLLASLLWAIPLLSFAYWQGDFRNSLHAYDVGVYLIAGLGIPLILYWRTSNRFALSVGVASTTFLTVFVVEDILGPFSPLWYYASMGPGLYTLRTLCLGAALALSAWGPVPRVGRVRGRAEGVRLGLALLMAMSSAVVLGEAGTEKFLLSPTLFRPDSNWVGYLVLFYFSTRKTDARLLTALYALQAVSVLGQLGYGLFHPDAGPWNQLRILGLELGAVLTIAEARRWFSVSRAGSYTKSFRSTEPSPEAGATSPAK